MDKITFAAFAICIFYAAFFCAAVAIQIRKEQSENLFKPDTITIYPYYEILPKARNLN